MKRFVVAAVMLLSSLGLAQEVSDSPLGVTPTPTNANITEQLVPVTRSDVYCSGFITKQKVSRSSFVAAGDGSPLQDFYSDRNFIFIKGKNFQPGNLVSIIREVKNPDGSEPYANTNKLLKKAGQPFFDIGYARIKELRADVAVAQIELACQQIIPGDLVIPFIERPTINARTSSTLDRFPSDQPAISGQIAMIKDFEQYAGAGQKVYINLGWEKGVKCGDYYRITRSFSPKTLEKSDASEAWAVKADDTQKNPPHLGSGKKLSELPRRVVGEVIILDVTPTSATGMVTFSLEPLHAGDVAELEPAQVETAQNAGN